jgi:hypothetical protein
VRRKPSGPTGLMKMEKGPTGKPSGPTGRIEKGSISETQAIGSHKSGGDGEGSYRSNGDGERCRRVPHVGHVTCNPSGPTGQMERKVPSSPTSRMEKGPQAQVTCKPSGPIGQMEMEEGPIGTHDT